MTKFSCGACILLVVLAIVATCIKSKGYGVTYQVSDSMPKGFYWVMPATHLQRNDRVIFDPPETAKRFLQLHHWLPDKGWMMKKIKGMPGDEVCTKNHALWINHQYFGKVYTEYAAGKVLPKKDFCETLKEDQYLLLSTRAQRSYDGRYFGPVKRTRILGKVSKIAI